MINWKAVFASIILFSILFGIVGLIMLHPDTVVMGVVCLGLLICFYLAYKLFDDCFPTTSILTHEERVEK